MPSYVITREVATPLFVPNPFVLGGIRFDSSEAPQSTGSIYASGEQVAVDMKTALGEFESRLRPVLDVLTVGVLVATSTYTGSLLVDRPDLVYAFFRWLRVSPSSFTLTESEREGFLGPAEGALAELAESSLIAKAARHFRESLLHGSVLVACIHLLRGVEALTGKGDFSELIGDAEYKFFYKKPGMRHRLMHGEEVEQSELLPHMEALRSAVQARLRAAIGYSETSVLARPMSPYSFTPKPLWLVSQKPMPALSRLVKMAETGILHYTSDPAMVGAEHMQEAVESF